MIIFGIEQKGKYMRFAKIDNCEMANGKFVGVSVYFQGCEFHCKDCFNPETWDFNSGKEWNKQIEEYILKLCNKPYIKRLSILGGEPMHHLNIEGVIHLSKCFKTIYSDKKIWIWTGYLFDEIPNKEILKYADYIIDGKFEENKKDLTLKFRGSSNQRIWEKSKGIWQMSKLN